MYVSQPPSTRLWNDHSVRYPLLRFCTGIGEGDIGIRRVPSFKWPSMSDTVVQAVVMLPQVAGKLLSLVLQPDSDQMTGVLLRVLGGRASYRRISSY
jgi:hypothetical protein